MSRLGDLLLLERTRQKLTRKQVARQCGISENYLKDVEEGRRIIQDDQARRILRKIGTGSQNQQESEFTLDEIAAAVDLSTLPQAQTSKAAPVPAPATRPVYTSEEPTAKKEDASASPSGIWLDALSSVVRPVPVMNVAWQETGRRMLPITDGKIEGAKPDRAVYFLAPDDSMAAMRIERGDLVLVLQQSVPVDGAIMLVEYGAHRCLRRVRLLGNAQVLLQSGDREQQAEALRADAVRFIGHAVRVEHAL